MACVGVTVRPGVTSDTSFIASDGQLLISRVCGAIKGRPTLVTADLPLYSDVLVRLVSWFVDATLSHLAARNGETHRCTKFAVQAAGVR